jgi:hypothetical protein
MSEEETRDLGNLLEGEKAAEEGWMKNEPSDFIYQALRKKLVAF